MLLCEQKVEERSTPWPKYFLINFWIKNVEKNKKLYARHISNFNDLENSLFSESSHFLSQKIWKRKT